ncbi:MAG: DUF1330 domain-containing protein [Roseitalea sp.]|nr:DUF1330 domain-containing protein [Roseitalea sp.]MBO6721815.1 DUF1330 domain-containing protein [Roseitalea sp.]MBO6744871.1 DUF1330 domain-containing protein [Roseitalea sp.]
MDDIDLAGAVKTLASTVNPFFLPASTLLMHTKHIRSRREKMTALIVARFDVKNAESMDAYAAAAGPTVLAHGGEFVAMGEKVSALVGEDEKRSVAMVRFSDVASAKRWFDSPEYSACKPLREEAAEMQFTLYETE